MSNLSPVNPNGIMPSSPRPSSSWEEFQDEMIMWTKRMSAAMEDYLNILNTSANVGFTSASDGTNEQDADDQATLYFEDGSIMHLEEVGGTMMFTNNVTVAAANNLVEDILNGVATTRITGGLIELSSS